MFPRSSVPTDPPELSVALVDGPDGDPNTGRGVPVCSRYSVIGENVHLLRVYFDPAYSTANWLRGAYGRAPPPCFCDAAVEVTIDGDGKPIW